MPNTLHNQYRHATLRLSGLFALVVLLQVACFSLFHLRHEAKRELSLQASMLATAYRDGETGNAPLQRATHNSDLLLACYFDRDGAVLAAEAGGRYGEFQDSAQLDADPIEQCSRFNAGLTEHYRFISRKLRVADPHLPRSMGQVLLVGATGNPLDHYGWALLIFAVSIVVFGILCAWIGLFMRRTMLRPIRQIATTAQRVSLYKDYSLRVHPSTLRNYPQEIAMLIDSFNAMLAEIEDRDTRLMRKTTELEKSRAAAEAANIAKSQFLANISHELRTPLNAVIGFSTMMQDTRFAAGNTKVQEYARDIHDSGRHLLDIINDILDLSHAESGKLSVRFEQLQLPRLIDKALNIVAGEAAARNIAIVKDIPEKMPKLVADRVRMVQVLLNILSNAIKFSHEDGRVTIRVRAEEGRGGVTYFMIDVEDQGIGMTEEEVAQAFTSFNQGDGGLNRRYEGTGLGLPLAKRLIELHHGRIVLESSKGIGTKVTIRLVSDPALLD